MLKSSCNVLPISQNIFWTLFSWLILSYPLRLERRQPALEINLRSIRTAVSTYCITSHSIIPSYTANSIYSVSDNLLLYLALLFPLKLLGCWVRKASLRCHCLWRQVEIKHVHIRLPGKRAIIHNPSCPIKIYDGPLNCALLLIAVSPHWCCRLWAFGRSTRMERTSMQWMWTTSSVSLPQLTTPGT